METDKIPAACTALTVSGAENKCVVTVQPESPVAEPEPPKKGKAKAVLMKILRILAIIASSLLSVILALLLTVGILLGTFAKQMSGESVANALKATDFYKMFTAMGVDDELSFLYNRAVTAISSESTDYYLTLEEFLSSGEFRSFVSDGVDRIADSFGEDGFSIFLRPDDVMNVAGFLKGPIEQHFGYTLTESDMDIVASVLDIIGIGGKLMTIPMGEAMGIIQIARLLMADTLRYAVYFLCILTAALIMLLNLKHYRTGSIMCAVPLVLVCVTWAGFALTATAVLMVLNYKFSAFVYPILAYTAPARDYMAETSLGFLIIAAILLMIPWIYGKVKRLISKQSA